MLLSKRKLLILLSIGVVALLLLVTILFTLNREPVTEPSVEPIVIEEVQETKVVERPVVIGSSVEGRPIEAYTYGTGETHLLFVGGIHGGYEWNSVLLAYELIDYYEQNINTIPEGMAITIIPSLNPDGVYAVLQKEGRFTLADTVTIAVPEEQGRFNTNNVDLNRNFACKWQPKSTWRGSVVSAGTSAFSEPEAIALRDFVASTNPSMVAFFHSQSNAVYASECQQGVLPETVSIMNAYATASGYKPIETFDAYPITGDAEGWLASIGIPAITVELATHESTEWKKNLAGVQAVVQYYTAK